MGALAILTWVLPCWLTPKLGIWQLNIYGSCPPPLKNLLTDFEMHRCVAGKCRQRQPQNNFIYFQWGMSIWSYGPTYCKMPMMFFEIKKCQRTNRWVWTRVILAASGWNRQDLDWGWPGLHGETWSQTNTTTTPPHLHFFPDTIITTLEFLIFLKEGRIVLD